MKILFVCAGNTCRSVMAEYIMKKASLSLGHPGSFAVSSCGLFAVPGRGANPLTLQALGELGIDAAGHGTAGVNERIISEADLVLVMEMSQKQLLKAAYGKYGDKIFTLRGYGAADEDIGDPYGSDIVSYRHTRDLIFSEIERIIKILPPEEDKNASH